MNYLLRSSPLHKQEVQRRKPKHEEGARHDSQSRNITPKRQHIKAETAQDRTARNFNVEAVLLIDERQVADFVHDQAFEAEVEDGELWVESVSRCVIGNYGETTKGS